MKFDKLDTINLLMVFLIMNFIMLAFVIGLNIFIYQSAQRSVEEVDILINKIQRSDQISSNSTDRLVKANLAGTDRNYITLVNRTEQLSNLIIKNQELIKGSQTLIKNTTETNLKNTFVNRDHISEILAEHVNIIHQLQSIQRALNITDQQVKQANNTED